MLVFKAVVHYPLNIHLLELFKHAVHIIVRHTRTVKSDNRAEIQELTHNFAVFSGSLSSLGGNFSRFSNHFQRSVWSKIENKAFFFHFTIDSSRRLHSKNGLHIRRSRSVV